MLVCLCRFLLMIDPLPRKRDAVHSCSTRFKHKVHVTVRLPHPGLAAYIETFGEPGIRMVRQLCRTPKKIGTVEHRHEFVETRASGSAVVRGSVLACLAWPLGRKGMTPVSDIHTNQTLLALDEALGLLISVKLWDLRAPIRLCDLEQNHAC